MKQFFSTLPRNIVECFRGRRLIWHAVAIVLTVILVMTGLDWRYFVATRHPVLLSWMFPAVRVGGLLPIVLPLFLLPLGAETKSAKISLAGFAIGQAELIGALVVAAYKAVTGREHPSHIMGPDISHTFRFGFLRGGVFWGWPSSHTTVAFSMAFAIWTLFPKQRALGCAAIAYAFYIGVGISMTIHWFSDFVAGAIIGTLIGTVVGKNFYVANCRCTDSAN
jgi:membrane-associated phospholipid phosphatase